MSDDEVKPRVTLSSRAWNSKKYLAEDDDDDDFFKRKTEPVKASVVASNAKSESESEEEAPAPAPTPKARSFQAEINVNVRRDSTSEDDVEEQKPTPLKTQYESDYDSEDDYEEHAPVKSSNFQPKRNIPVTSLSGDESENCSDEANDVKNSNFKVIEEMSTSEDEPEPPKVTSQPAPKIVTPSKAPNLAKYSTPTSAKSAPSDIPTLTKPVKLSNFAYKALEKVAQAEGFKNYKFTTGEGSAVGEGFSGVLSRVTIIESDNSRELSVIVKSPPENEVQRATVGTMKLFEREVCVYSDLLPELMKFQKEFYLTCGFYEFPKCYLAEYDREEDDAVIILEDLRDNGYKMVDRNDPINYEHAKLAYAALGRLHGVSLAMKDRSPKIFQRFQELTDNTKGNLDNKAIISYMEGCLDKAIATLRPDEVKRREKMSDYKANLADLMRELTNPEGAEPFAVISHGDCWANNFMFKYRSGRPEKIALLDFQATRYCSAACDLTYFTFTCTDQELRKKYYDEFLTIYYQSVKDVLERVRSDVMKVFPFTALVRQMKKFGKYGIFISCFILPMLSMKTEDLPDTNELFNTLKNSDNQHFLKSMEKGLESDELSKRLRGNLDDAFKYGYL